MIERNTDTNKTTFDTAMQPVKPKRNLLQGFFATIGLFAIGAVATVFVIDRLPNTSGAPTAAEGSTAQMLLDIISPQQAAPEPLFAAATPAPAVAPQADISQPGLEDLVTRSIGSLANEPIQIAPEAFEQPAPAAVPAALETNVPSVIDPTQLFTASSTASRGGCVADLRNLTAETRVYFPSGGVTADNQGLVQARLIGFVAQSCPGVVIQVEGHSDPSGDPVINMRLSEERAQAVIARLASSGVDTSNFRAVGFGDRQPSLIRGTQSAAFYDRRVEFSVVESSAAAPGFSGGLTSGRAVSACVTQLQNAADRTRLFFAPGSITAPQSDLAAVYQLAAAASACPDARLRVIGQFSDDLGSGETPATARLRAIALMSGLVASGFAPEQIIIAAPSRPTTLANAPGVSERRIDFDVILEEL